jgi:hypothetical protein
VGFEPTTPATQTRCASKLRYGQLPTTVLGGPGRPFWSGSTVGAVAARIERIEIGASPERWREAGFAVDEDGMCRLGQVAIQLVDDGGRGGIRAWTLSGVDLGGRTEIEGIAADAVDPSPMAEPVAHANGAGHIDHVVLVTPDLGRTIETLETIGPELRRVRDIGTPESPMQQAFFRLGEVILEVVGPPDRSNQDPARWYGLAIDVADLAQPAALLGGRLGPIKDAVQPGRRIATLHDAPDSLAVAVAFMDGGATG